jgi:transposase
LCVAVDALLASMNSEFEAVYAQRGRPSVPPEMLLDALLLQILFSIRSERQLVKTCMRGQAKEGLNSKGQAE